MADAGRWVIGMEDWNSKMDKRLQQINELVLLANTWVYCEKQNVAKKAVEQFY